MSSSSNKLQNKAERANESGEIIEITDSRESNGCG